MYCELYKSKAMYHDREEIGAIYYGNNLLWKKSVIRKYTFTHIKDIKLNYYLINKVKLFKNEENIKLDRIRVEYKNYNMFNVTQVYNDELLLMPTNIIYSDNIIEGDIIQKDKENGNIFFIDNNNRKIIVHDKFGNFLGSTDVHLKGDISNILVDFQSKILYVFLNKTYGEFSVSKYSFKVDNFYSDILE